MKVLVLAAFEAELTPLLRHLGGCAGVRSSLTGMGPELAAAAARREIPGSDLVVSTGCCGGLQPGLATGTLVIPDRVLLEGGASMPTDPGWRDAARAGALRLGLPLEEGPLLTVVAPLLEPAAKRACAERTGACAVDMETAAVFTVAAELGVPHLAVRVVLDACDDEPDLPALLRRLAAASEGLGRCLAECLKK
jgi:adenosylhomocysteine nucleosidase